MSENVQPKDMSFSGGQKMSDKVLFASQVPVSVRNSMDVVCRGSKVVSLFSSTAILVLVHLVAPVDEKV